MAENLQDNLGFGASSLAVSGDAIVVGTQAGAKSVIFSNPSGAGHLNWQPTANHSVTVPNADGVIMLTSQAILSISAGGAAITSGQAVFSNSNGVSFGVNGQTVTGSVAAQTNQTAGFYAVGNTTQNSSTTLDARTLSFNGLGIASVGYSNGSIQISVPSGGGIITLSYFAIGNTTQNSSTVIDQRSVSMNGLGIVTIGFSNGSIDISASQSAQSVGFYAVGNTTQSSSTTLDARTVSYNGLGAVTIGYSNGSIDISAPVQTNQSIGYYAVGNTTQNSSTTLDARTVSFDALGAMTMGYSNGSIQVSAPAVSTLTGVGGVIVSSNGSTISISGPNIINFEPLPVLQSGSTTYLPGVGSWYFEPIELPGNLSGGRINRLLSFTGTPISYTATASYGTGTTGGKSYSGTYGNTLALYSLNGTGANSTQLASFWSNTFSVGVNMFVSVSMSGAASTNLTVTNGLSVSYVASINSAGAYTTSVFSSSNTAVTAAANLATTALSSIFSSMQNMLSGQMIVPIGFNSTIPPGNYWLAQAYSSASTTSNTTGQATLAISQWNLVNQVANLGASGAIPFRIWGQTVSTSGSQPYPGRGTWSVVSASPPSTVAFSDIRAASNSGALIQYFNWVNSTI